MKRSIEKAQTKKTVELLRKYKATVKTKKTDKSKFYKNFMYDNTFLIDKSFDL